MTPQYSGNRSRKIWDRVNKLKGIKHEVIYSMFVLLQDIEGRALQFLKNYEKKGK